MSSRFDLIFGSLLVVQRTCLCLIRSILAIELKNSCLNGHCCTGLRFKKEPARVVLEEVPCA
jgi:hypothetical protein